MVCVLTLTAFPQPSLVDRQGGKKRLQVYFGLVQQFQDVHLLPALWWLNRCEVWDRVLARGSAAWFKPFKRNKNLKGKNQYLNFFFLTQQFDRKRGEERGRDDRGSGESESRCRCLLLLPACRPPRCCTCCWCFVGLRLARTEVAAASSGGSGPRAVHLLPVLTNVLLLTTVYLCLRERETAAASPRCSFSTSWWATLRRPAGRRGGEGACTVRLPLPRCHRRLSFYSPLAPIGPPLLLFPP